MKAPSYKEITSVLFLILFISTKVSAGGVTVIKGINDEAFPHYDPSKSRTTGKLLKPAELRTMTAQEVAIQKQREALSTRSKVQEKSKKKVLENFIGK